MKRAIIVGSGTKPSVNLEEMIVSDTMILAVDGGYDYLKYQGVNVDTLIGDFDSINYPIEEINDIQVLEYPRNKAATDMEIAIDFAIDKGVNEIIIFGATGSRMDHTLANILLLLKISSLNIEGKIIDNNNEISVLKGEKTIYKSKYKYLSLIALEENTCVSISGVRYPLEDKILDFPTSLTVSNEIIEDSCTLKSSKELILIQSND